MIEVIALIRKKEITLTRSEAREKELEEQIQGHWGRQESKEEPEKNIGSNIVTALGIILITVMFLYLVWLNFSWYWSD